MVKPMKKEKVALIQRGCDRKKAVEGGGGMSGVKPVLLLRRERCRVRLAAPEVAACSFVLLVQVAPGMK